MALKIALLRGINVCGNRKIKTYIQSGNILFFTNGNYSNI